MEMNKLKELALTVTGTFEGSAFDTITGNFDGQLMSCGILQWCLGQKSLQNEILRPFILRYENYDAEYTLKIPLLLSGAITPEWWAGYIMNNPQMKALYKKLLGTPEMRTIQMEAAERLFKTALNLLGGEAGLERYGDLGFLWAFDIAVQNGGFKGLEIPHEVPMPPFCWAEITGKIREQRAKRRIAENNEKLWDDMLVFEGQESEHGNVTPAYALAPLFYLTFDRAEKCVEAWKGDVLTRKLSILFGKGYVHGHYINIDSIKYNLEKTND